MNKDEFRRRFWPIWRAVMGIFSVLMVATTLRLALVNADLAQQKTAALQQEITDLRTSPFRYPIAFGGVYRVTNPPANEDSSHTVFAHPGDHFKLSYALTTSRSVPVEISITFDGVCHMSLASISKTFRSGMNTLEIDLTIPSGLTRYTWETLEIQLFEPGHFYIPPQLQGARFFIVEPGVLLPGPVVLGQSRIVPAPPSNLPLQPPCSDSSALQSPGL